MSNTYQYGINNLTWYMVPFDGKDNVVYQALWTLSATDGQGHNVSSTQSLNIPFDPKAPFTPLDKLTPDQTIGWVKATIQPAALAAIQASLDDQIAALAHPTSSGGVPWNK